MILIIQRLFSAFFKIKRNLVHNFENIDIFGAFIKMYGIEVGIEDDLNGVESQGEALPTKFVI